MSRIKEIYFFLNGNEFQLTYFKNENPKLFKDGKEFNRNKSEILRNYIIELGLGNTLFKNQTTQQLSSFLLNHFSNKSIKNKVQVKSISNKKNHLKNESSQNDLDQKKLILSENFNVVIICSKKKKKSNFDDYPEIKFKAVTNKINEFHPDDLMPNSDVKWRKYLEEHQNDKSLLSAFDLYSRKEYRSLYEKFNKSLYILSAGWGLVNSEFKLPNYDITFSSTGEPETKRKTNDLNAYQDFNQMSLNENEDIIFIGSPNYIPVFIEMTKDLTNRKIIYWKNKTLKRIAPNDTFEYRYFNTSINTIWHYELAKNIANGIIP